MLYKRLLDALLQPSISASPPPSRSLERLSFPEVWDHVSVNPHTHFSAQFLDESVTLVLDSKLGQEAFRARCLHDLERVWQTTILELGTGAGNEGDEDSKPVSNMLKLVYRLRESGGAGRFKKPLAKSSRSSEGIIGNLEFEYDEAFLDNYLRDVLDFWHEGRPPRGVSIENIRRCT